MKVASLLFAFAVIGSVFGASSNSAGDLSGAASGFDCSFFLRQPTETDPLDTVLKKMDAVAASFRAIQAEFEWDRYEKVIDEVDDVQKGTIYYRRNGKDIEVKIDVKTAGPSAAEVKPEPKFVLVSGGKIQMYQPKADTLTVYALGKNAADFESYLALGFGSSGQDLVKTFDVTYVGAEKIDGVNTAKLHLVPKSERVRNNFKEILLWIDLDRGISVQQQFFEPQGDNRLAKYSGIQMKEKLGDDIFRLKTTSKTQIVNPRG
jgi:outer membrane lipoprotein-sorting protein